MKVLLATAGGPYEAVWGESLHDLFTSRLSRGHGVFSMSSHWHPFGLHLIAENLGCPVTVLEEPGLAEFEAELANGYDIVGLQVMSRHTLRLARMAQSVRRLAPEARLVLGGAGAGALEDDVPRDPQGAARILREAAHEVCREEGVSFMRRLAGEDPSRPVTQERLPLAGFSARGFLRRYMRVPVVLAATGCPSGCEFCNTSALTRKVKTRVAEPEQAYAAMKAQARRMGASRFLTMVFDEDLFSEPEWPRRLGALIRKDRASWGWKWFSFGSVRSLSRFDPEEVRDLGCGAVWTGLESLGAADESAGPERLPKREGDASAVVEGLSRAGVLVVASLVLGFDHQTRERAERDIDWLVRLRPPFYQVGPLQPCPGTPLFKRLRREGRLDEGYGWDDFHLFNGDWARHRHLGRGEVKELFELAHERLARENGPPFLRMLEVFLNAAESCAGRAGDFHAAQRRFYEDMASFSRPLLAPMRRLVESPKVREEAASLEERCLRVLGPKGLVGRGMEALALLNFTLAARRGAAAPAVYDPGPRWTLYNQDAGGRVLVRKGRAGALRARGRLLGAFG